MKTLIITTLILLFGFTGTGQDFMFTGKTLKTTDGADITVKQILKPGSPTLLVFWKSGSNACCDNLETLQDVWTDSLRDLGVRLIAICIDCKGTWSHIKPLMAGRRWDFDTYIDVNGDFKRAMNVNTSPSIILLDENQQQVCRYNGTCSGNDQMICETVIRHLK